MPGDAYYPNVSLLLSMNGSNNGTTFTDTSPTPKTVTRYNALTKTDKYKWNGSSGYFDGTGDYLDVGYAFEIGSTAGCTCEGWFYIAGNAALDNSGNRNAALFGIHDNGTDSNDVFQIHIMGDANTTGTGIAVEYKIGGTLKLSDTFAALTLTQQTWCHFAFCADGDGCRVYINGTSVISVATVMQTTPASFSRLFVGRSHNRSVYYRDLNGYLQDFRITKGVARYTADFTAPTAAFLNYAGQIAGIITDDASDPVARVVRAYRRDTGALVGNTTSSAVDGSYSMDLPTLDQCSVIALDDAEGDVYNDLIARVTPA